MVHTKETIWIGFAYYITWQSAFPIYDKHVQTTWLQTAYL